MIRRARSGTRRLPVIGLRRLGNGVVPARRAILLALLLPVAALAQPLALGQRPNGATPEPISFVTSGGDVFRMTKDGGLGSKVKGYAPRGAECRPAMGHGLAIYGTWPGSRGRVALCVRRPPG